MLQRFSRQACQPPMRKLYPNLFLAGLLYLCSCSPQKVYYQSPIHTFSNNYKTLPLIADSVQAVTYGSAMYSGGGANQHQRDNINAFQASLYRAHTFGQKLQAYYGVTGMLGDYEVKRYQQDLASSFYDRKDSIINSRAGNKFFGGAGFTGGINITHSFKGGEWRAVSAEVNWLKEFGSYQSFRKNMPDTIPDLNDKTTSYFTFAFGTEILFKTKKGAFGMKLSRVYYPRTLKRSRDDKGKEGWTGFVSPTLHVTVNRITGFVQGNFGSYAMSAHLGANFRL